MISVIIPAHNEETVIRRCLDALLTNASPGEFDVTVVCNGCHDQTAQVARSFGAAVRVIETHVASKVGALNLGDAATDIFPRFYVDADVVLQGQGIRQLAGVLASGRTLAVAPRFRMELSACSWFVRAFYEINGRLPSSCEGIGGSGVYGLSKEGRQRFASFPQITADDRFVRVHFRPDERLTSAESFSAVFAPRCLRDLIHIKTRSHYGNIEINKLYPDLVGNGGTSNRGALLRLAFWPRLWPALLVYFYVKSVAKMRAYRRWRSATANRWERDETSRPRTSPAVTQWPR